MEGAITRATVLSTWKRDAMATLVFLSSMAILQGQASHSSEDQETSLASIRQYALSYAQNLPDFTCTRVTHQRTSLVISMYALNPELSGQHPDNGPSATVDITEELTVADRRESYKILKKEKTFPRLTLPDEAFGTISMGEFSGVLTRLFAPDNEATFRFVRSGNLRGRPALVFSFEVPPAHGAHVYDNVERRELVKAYKGLIYADAESKAVLRVEAHMTDFPSESEFRGIDLTLDYKAVKIGESEFVLPYRFDLQWHRHKPGTLAKARTLPEESSVAAEYKNYRVSSAQSAVRFGGTAPESDVRSAITFGEIIAPVKP